MKNEAGFTLMETLCAVALVLICASAAGGLIYSARRITGDVHNRASRQFRHLQMERIIRETVESVAIPYWEEDGNGLREARHLIEKALSGAGYKIDLELVPVKDGFGRIRGVSCRCFFDVNEYEVAGLFASVPLVRDRL